MVSPMIVERRWPTCISFATLGDEKSTSTFCFFAAGGFAPSAAIACTREASHVGESHRLMKPGPATSCFARIAPPIAPICAASAAPTSRGLFTPSGSAPRPLSWPKSPIAALFW